MLQKFLIHNFAECSFYRLIRLRFVSFGETFSFYKLMRFSLVSSEKEKFFAAMCLQPAFSAALMIGEIAVPSMTMV